MAAEAARLFASHAWIDGTWRERVLFTIDRRGHWASITPDVPDAPADALRVDGYALPGVVNGHSHAFQRAFAGQAEHRGEGADDFWSWRDRMYAVANRITPGDLREIATRLYGEMLRGGYTHVCEFHYLHHAPDGTRYADPLAMARPLCDAAAATGIGLTVLPVLYERAGFTEERLRDDQRRFAASVDDVVALRDGIRALRLPNVGAGIAIHSLRAARPASIVRLVERSADDAGPIHMHVAEQQSEVDECLAASGRRPIEWLLDAVAVDARWQLVHATHATRAEIEGIASRGAGVVLCPTTEANLGDGITDLPGWLAAGVPLAIGSDSQVTLDWREELRLLEYGQRLVHRRRNVAADARRSSATRLFVRVIEGGGRAAGFARWGFVAGARADMVVADRPGLATGDGAHAQVLDEIVFVSPADRFRAWMVAGAWLRRDGATAPAA